MYLFILVTYNFMQATIAFFNLCYFEAKANIFPLGWAKKIMTRKMTFAAVFVTSINLMYSFNICINCQKNI